MANGNESVLPSLKMFLRVSPLSPINPQEHILKTKNFRSELEIYI
jgi:hypothetical protein